MSDITIAKRYGGALYELAVEAGILDHLASDLAKLKRCVESIPSFVRALGDMIVNRKVRKTMVDSISDELSLENASRNFLKLLIDKDRIDLLPTILDDTEMRVRKHLNMAKVHAKAAGKDFMDEVRLRIEEILGSALKLKVNCAVSVDESLLGGFLLRIGDVTFDASVKGKMTRMMETIF